MPSDAMIPPDPMNDDAFDAAMIAAAFAEAARVGWPSLSVAQAARAAGLDLARARQRFTGKAAVLLRFGQAADRAALSEAEASDAVPQDTQERLFDRLMRRIDVLQAHRAGMLALLRALPADPPTALMLGMASLASMRWLLEASDIPTQGPLGLLRAEGLLAVWLWTLRTWRTDDSADLSATMATLDTALARAAQIARSLPGAKPAPTPALGD